MMEHEFIITETAMCHASKFSSFPVVGEIIRCRGCKKADKQEWKCNHFAVGYWDAEQEADVIIRPDIKPNGFCAWAERDV